MPRNNNHRNNNHIINNNHEAPNLPPLSISLRLDDDKPETALSLSLERYYSPLTSPLPATPPQPPPPPPLPQQVQTAAVVYRGGDMKVRGDGRKKEAAAVAERIGVLVRVLEMVFCVVSFSVMSVNRTQGWSGDSFDRYIEYRFCLTVAIVGFVYSTFQAYDLCSHVATGKHVIAHRFRYQFDFIMDQILAYLLISASSAAASRVEDWQMNWGKDEFTEKATASISMGFLAFVCFAVSSLMSGYNLCNRDLY